MEIRNDHLTDDQLDALIRSTFERRQALDGMNAEIMKSLQRSSRRTWLCRWGRVVAFSFGLPFLFLLFVWLLWPFISEHGISSPVYLCLLIPLVAMIYLLMRMMAFFSTETV